MKTVFIYWILTIISQPGRAKLGLIDTIRFPHLRLMVFVKITESDIVSHFIQFQKMSLPEASNVQYLGKIEIIMRNVWADWLASERIYDCKLILASKTGLGDFFV